MPNEPTKVVIVLNIESPFDMFDKETGILLFQHQEF